MGFWERLLRRIKNRRLQVDILTIFFCLLSVSSILNVWYTYTRNAKSTLKLASDMADAISNNMVGKVQEFLSDAKIHSDIGASLVTSVEEVSPENRELVSYMISTVREFPFIELFGVGTKEGNYLGVGTLPEGATYQATPGKPLPEGSQYGLWFVDRKGGSASELWIYYNSLGKVVGTEKVEGVAYDPRVRPWYKAVNERKGVYWTGVYKFTESLKNGITYAVPVFSPSGELIGAAETNISLSIFSSFLSTQKIGKTGKIVIFDPEKQIIAASDLAAGSTPHTLDNYDPVFQVAYQNFLRNQNYQFTFQSDGKEYLAFLSSFPLAEEKWTIAIVAPASDFLGDIIRTSQKTVVISVVILLISWMFIVFFSKRISSPIVKLSYEADKIKNLDFEGEVDIHSHIKEINLLSNSLSGMKSGLRSFSSYVPKEIVRQLIVLGRPIRLGGEKKEVTLFFSDIVHFTEIAESLPIEKLLPYLDAYFDALSRVVLKLEGTIDKYMGDNIMAFWGAPQDVVEPEKHACRAALLCQYEGVKLNKKSREQGLPEMLTRIGIHRGAVIVGNIGTLERMNYTVIGDAVNLASRLEGINKIYNTQIIISEAVQQKVRDSFLTRFLDIVAVKGKHEQVKIYELLGEEGGEEKLAPTEEQRELCREFARGMTVYRDRKWGEALQIFEVINKKYPLDYPTRLYLERSREYALTPPGNDWDGVTRLSAK